MTFWSASNIRTDAGGSGEFGAPRTKFKNGKLIKYRHEGIDFKCEVGEAIPSPCAGKVVRIAYPYADDLKYQGLLLDARRCQMMMFYLMPFRDIIGSIVRMGDLLGTAQDISKKYEKVTPHIHLQVSHCDPMILLEA